MAPTTRIWIPTLDRLGVEQVNHTRYNNDWSRVTTKRPVNLSILKQVVEDEYSPEYFIRI